MYKVSNPENFRNNVRKNLEEFIPHENKCKNIEIGIYNYSIQEATNKKIIKKWDNQYFVELYISKLRTIFSNLIEPLTTKIMNGEILPHKVAFMTHQELQPEKWAKMLDIKRKIDESTFSPNISATTDSFTCFKCRSNQCTYYQLQTRSADEPMTTFVTCINCFNRWRC